MLNVDALSPDAAAYYRLDETPKADQRPDLWLLKNIEQSMLNTVLEFSPASRYAGEVADLVHEFVTLKIDRANIRSDQPTTLAFGAEDQHEVYLQVFAFCLSKIQQGIGAPLEASARSFLIDSLERVAERIEDYAPSVRMQSIGLAGNLAKSDAPECGNPFRNKPLAEVYDRHRKPRGRSR